MVRYWYIHHVSAVLLLTHRLNLDSSHDHAELGAALNGFSLNESGQLSSAIEKTGQAVDATYMSTTLLASSYSGSHTCIISDMSIFPAARVGAELGGTTSRIHPVCHNN